MRKYKIIALIGKSGSGKDRIMRECLKANPALHEIISCTTRLPRDNETDGVNYHFVSAETFAETLLKNEMLEASVFNNWCYGTPFSSLSLDDINIGVFNPTGIESLQLHKNIIDLTVYYICVSDKERLIRQLNREKEPNIEEIFRRYKTDEEDFYDLSDLKNIIDLTNEKPHDIEKCVRTILDNI